MQFTNAALALALSVAVAGAAAAAAPQPVRPAPQTLYSGRWYEIALTPNKLQKNCEAPTNDFSGRTASGFSVVQTCHEGSVNGPKHTLRAHGHVLPASNNTKLELGFFGGLVSKQYWILDHASNDVWAIMSTADGRYVWLLSRQPSLDASVRATALARLQSLGFNLTRLAFPEQAPQ
ncbi:MAG TPA: lipocalin family protein [Caulobacteraceae bacterium]|nr:lipocalin family protein [Caulobacteraceae bacterium]